MQVSATVSQLSHGQGKWQRSLHQDNKTTRGNSLLKANKGSTNMRLIIRPSSSSVAEWVSRYVVKRIKDFAPTAEVRRPFSNNLIRFRDLIKSLLP